MSLKCSSFSVVFYTFCSSTSILPFNLASLYFSFRKTFLIPHGWVMCFPCTLILPCNHLPLFAALITLKYFQPQYIVSSLRVRAVSHSPVSGIKLTCSEYLKNEGIGKFWVTQPHKFTLSKNHIHTKKNHRIVIIRLLSSWSLLVCSLCHLLCSLFAQPHSCSSSITWSHLCQSH